MTRDEADNLLASAIQQHAEVYDLCRPDELLDAYAVVAHWQPEVADGRSRYTTQFDRPVVPSYVAVGLFATAIRLVWDDDDE